MRAANAPEGSVWCRWQEQEKHKVKLVKIAAPEPYRSVVYCGASGGRLGRILEAQGVTLSERAAGRTLYIVDAAAGAVAPDDGNDVWLWGKPLPGTAWTSSSPRSAALPSCRRSAPGRGG